MVNVFVFHAIEIFLLSAWNFCHLSSVEMLSEHCVCVWFLNRKFCLDKGRSFGEVVTMVLQNYTFLLSNGQWKALLNSILVMGVFNRGKEDSDDMKLLHMKCTSPTKFLQKIPFLVNKNISFHWIPNKRSLKSAKQLPHNVPKCIK